MGRRVLITGGAGFIGSHTCLVLLEQGHELVVLENFDNSSPEALRRVQELAGSTQLNLVEGDVRDPSAVDQAFSACLLYTSPSPRDRTRSRMPSSA